MACEDQIANALSASRTSTSTPAASRLRRAARPSTPPGAKGEQGPVLGPVGLMWVNGVLIEKQRTGGVATNVDTYSSAPPRAVSSRCWATWTVSCSSWLGCPATLSRWTDLAVGVGAVAYGASACSA